MYKPVIPSYFLRQLKPYVKKYHHLREAVISLLDNFHKEQHVAIGHNLYKARLRSKDIPRGKSKSFRIIVLVLEAEEYLVPIALYFKGDQEDIAKKEINRHLENVLLELRFML